MKSYSKVTLFAISILAMSLFFHACNKGNDAESNKNQKNIKKVDYSKILENVKKHILAKLEYSVGVDSLRFDIIIHNNSKHTVFYPSLKFVINDIYPMYEYIPRGLNNGNLINILPCGINAEDSMLELTIDDSNISPYYRSILSKDSLVIKFAIPFSNYIDRYHDELSSHPEFNCVNFHIHLFIAMNEVLARKFSAPSESHLVEYSSFKEYKDSQFEVLIFKQSDIKYSNSDYNDFHRSSFVVESDTILDIEAIYKSKIGANSNE